MCLAGDNVRIREIQINWYFDSTLITKRKHWSAGAKPEWAFDCIAHWMEYDVYRWKWMGIPQNFHLKFSTIF